MSIKSLLAQHMIPGATEADALKVQANCRWQGECLLWMGGTDPKTGFGFVRCENGKTRRVHRVIWEVANGVPPRDHFVIQKCSNHACCRLEHLELETAASRARRGIRARMLHDGGAVKAQALAAAHAPRHKRNQRLSMEVIMGIYDDTAFNGLSVRKAAKKYDCSPSTVDAIRTGKIWNHITNHHYDPNETRVGYSRGKIPLAKVIDVCRDERALRKIATDYGVSTATIHKIKHGYLYSDITRIPKGGEYDESRLN